MITKVDPREFSSSKITIKKAPIIELPYLHETTKVICEALEKGEIPVIGELDGERKVLCQISESAYNIIKLLTIYDEIFYTNDAGNKFTIRKVVEYLEVIV